VSWLPGEMFFRKGPPGPWTHHVHLTEPSHPRWQARLLFRDYLRAHPEAAQAYAKIKCSLATSSKDDIEAYRTGKSTFVEETTAKASAWRAEVQKSIAASKSMSESQSQLLVSPTSRDVQVEIRKVGQSGH
jgi:hypothetical protein